MKFEIELNRKWIYDSDGEVIGETNFVVPMAFAKKLYEEKFKENYRDFSFDEFLSAYEPESEGEYMYQQAILAGQLVEDLGIVMYTDV